MRFIFISQSKPYSPALKDKNECVEEKEDDKNFVKTKVFIDCEEKPSIKRSQTLLYSL